MKMNSMREIRIEKVTLNIGAGKEVEKLEKGFKLIQAISNRTPIKTVTNKRIPTWGLRPGLPIGCKVTVRKEAAKQLLARLLDAKEHKLTESQFDENGNIAFGLKEYIDIPGMKYDPEIGMMGLEACVTLERPGFRIKRRKNLKKSVPRRHRITKEEAIKFMQSKFNVKVGELE
jgi:large subunit ribosomal protein L5